MVEQPTLVATPAKKQVRPPSESDQLANEQELRMLASKRARLAKFLERVRQGSHYRAQTTSTTQPPQTVRYTTRPTTRPTSRPTNPPRMSTIETNTRLVYSET